VTSSTASNLDWLLDDLVERMVAGSNSCLALQAEDSADLGMVAYEMNLTVQRVGSYLSTAPRRTGAGTGPFALP
jgi:hypothetical protein